MNASVNDRVQTAIKISRAERDGERVGKRPLLSPIYNAGGVPGSRAGKARGICRDPRLVDECRVCEIL